MTDGIPKVDLQDLPDGERRELELLAFWLRNIRRQTGFGTLTVEIRDSELVEVRAETRIKPKLVKQV